MKSKWISVFLALFMILSLFAVPLQIWAEGDGVEEQGEAAQEENLNSGGGTAEGGKDTPVGAGNPETPPSPAGEPATTPGSGENGPQSSPEDPKPIHTVTILYLSNENPKRTLAQAYVATVPEGYPEPPRDIPSPVKEGYELVDPQQAVIHLDFSQLAEDKTIEVLYKPIEVSYKILHYKEDLDGGFTLAEEENATAPIGTEVSPAPKNYEGFSFQGLQETYTVPKTDNELKIELKYTRNSYQISFDSDGGTAVPGGIFKYEADLTTFKAQVPQPTKPGYTFVRWESSESTIPEIPEKMPAQDLTFTAVWQEGEATPYLIRYYVQNADDNDYTYAGSYQMTGKTGETITPPNDPENPHPGLVFPDLSPTQQKYWSRCFERNTKKTNEANENKTITADGLATIDVYYDRIDLEVRYEAYVERVTDGTLDPKDVDLKIEKNGKEYPLNVVEKGAQHADIGSDSYSFKLRLGQNISSLYVTTDNIKNIPTGHRHVFSKLVANPEDISMPRSFQRADFIWFKSGQRYGEGQNQYLLMKLVFLDYPVTIAPLKANVFREPLAIDGEGKELNQVVPYTKEPTEVLMCFEYKGMKGYGRITFKGYRVDYNYTKDFKNIGQAWPIKTDDEGNRYCDAYFKRNQYPLMFHTDPADWKSTWFNQPINVYYDVPLMNLPQVKEHPAKPQSIQNLEKTYHSEYAFAGWYLDPAYNIPLTDELKMRDSGTNHLYAKWAPKQDKVTLKFDSDGGSEVPEQAIDWGKAPTPVENPTKEGYRFLGWKEIQQYGQLANYYFSFKQNLYQDVKLKAIWEKVVSTDLTIRYVKGSEDNEEGEASPEEKVQGQKVGAIYTAQAKPIEGFLPDKVHKTLTLGQEGNVITFYYKPFTTVVYTIKYIASEFKDGKEVEKELGSEKITTEKAIDTQNYKSFPGYTPVDVQQVLILSQDVDANVMTFRYTKVADAKYTVEYYLSDGINDYQLVTELTKTIGAVPESQVSVTPEDVLTYQEHRYHFVEGKSTSTGIVKADNSLVLKLYYQAEPQPAKEYTIIFDANGGTFSDGSKIKMSKHPENNVIKIIDAPTWAGHTFLYWKGSKYYPGEQYTVVSDHTFTAIWDEDPDKPSLSITPQSGFVMGQPRLYSAAKPQMIPAQKPITQLPATGSANPAFVILLSLGLATLGLFLRKRS